MDPFPIGTYVFVPVWVEVLLSRVLPGPRDPCFAIADDSFSLNDPTGYGGHKAEYHADGKTARVTDDICLPDEITVHFWKAVDEVV